MKSKFYIWLAKLCSELEYKFLVMSIHFKSWRRLSTIRSISHAKVSPSDKILMLAKLDDED